MTTHQKSDAGTKAKLPQFESKLILKTKRKRQCCLNIPIKRKNRAVKCTQ